MRESAGERSGADRSVRVARELAGDADEGGGPKRSAARRAVEAVLAAVVVAAASLSLVVSVRALVGSGPPWPVARLLAVVLSCWAVLAAASFGLFLPGRGGARGRPFRLALVPELLLAPGVGQLLAVVMGVLALLRGRSGRERSVPRAVAALTLGLGWPAMVVTALLALEPTFASDVRLVPGSPVEWAGRLVLSPVDTLDPVLSALVVYGSATLLPLVLALSAAIESARQGRRAREARVAMAGGGALEAGGTVVVGAVELATGETHAARVEVDQRGNESESSGSWSHSWTEVDRRVSVVPFYLRRRDGERVRVEPRGKAFLMDDLDGVVLVDRWSRTRVAELVPGEEVVAVGRLGWAEDPETSGGGYRGPGAGWVLEPPADGPMLLASRPIDGPFQRRAAIYGWMVAALAVLALVGHGILAPYHQRVFAGRPGEATIAASSVEISDGDGDEDHSATYRLTLAPTDGAEPFVETVPEEVYSGLPERALAPIVAVPGSPRSAQIGSAPRAHMFVAFLALVMALVGFAFQAAAESGKEWYDGEKVVNSGAGKLPDPPAEPAASPSET